MPFTTQTSGVTLTLPGEVLRIEAWGTSTIRVRSSVSGDVVPVTEGLSVTEPTEARNARCASSRSISRW